MSEEPIFVGGRYCTWTAHWNGSEWRVNAWGNRPGSYVGAFHAKTRKEAIKGGEDLALTISDREKRAIAAEHPSMPMRRLQCAIDGHFTQAGGRTGVDDPEWMGPDRHLCLVCGEQTTKQPAEWGAI